MSQRPHRLKHDLSTPENRAWWASVKQAAKEAPRLAQRPRTTLESLDFAALVYQLCAENPDQRAGQLLHNALRMAGHTMDIFYLSDSEFTAALRRWVEGTAEDPHPDSSDD